MLIDPEYAYRGGVLFCEGASLAHIATTYGTPVYVYSKASIIDRYRAYADALKGIPHRICFAVKANSNLAVLNTLAGLGSGFDIVSGGELYRVLKAGAPAERVVFSGVGKTVRELEYALEQGIHSFNCESEAELHVLSETATRVGRKASIALRVNPHVDAATHPYISTGLREHKFGTDIDEVERLYAEAAELPGLVPEGVSCHIGSQLLDFRPILEAADKVLELVQRLRQRGLPIRYLDLGGGLGVRYRSTDHAGSIPELINAFKAKIAGKDLFLMIEPGRSIVAEAGVLLTRVILTKKSGHKRFVVVDAAMNDLMRPSLYQAHHEIVPVCQPDGRPPVDADIVGPVCESGDFFARSRHLPPVQTGDLLAIQTAGAYGFALASNYNSRPRVAEILVDNRDAHLVRERESWDDLIRGERVVPSVAPA